MANERVSQLTAIVASEMSPDDLFLVTDTSARESKRLSAEQLLLFVEASGSFDVLHATNADTASYVLGSNVHGLVTSASHALYSDSGSYALQANRSLTASYADNVTPQSDSASFLRYTGAANGTASYALISNLTQNARTSSFLIYVPGQNNGTASYTILAESVTSASYGLKSSSSLVSAAAATATSASYALSSSYAYSASYAPFTSPFPVFIDPIHVIGTGTAATAFITIDLSPYVPATARIAILDGWATNANTDNTGFIYIRKDSSSASYILTSFRSHGGGDSVSMGGQGMFPLSATRTFQYSISQAADQGWTLRLVGYF
jgi:hypothetical protein